MLDINLDAWLYITAAVEFNPRLEVAGFGKIKLIDGHVLLTDILIPPQEIGAAHADIAGVSDKISGMEWLLQEILARGDQPGDWRLWWHSHGRMGTSPSSTDHDTLKTLARAYRSWAVGLVVNAAHEVTAWAAMENPIFPAQQTELSLPVHVEAFEDPAITAQVGAWMKHVTEAKSYSNYKWMGTQPWQTRLSEQQRNSRVRSLLIKADTEGWGTLTEAEMAELLETNGVDDDSADDGYGAG